jgi:hypothetical protein
MSSFHVSLECIVCTRKILIFRSILGFWFILHNEVIPFILCHSRLCDGIRPDSLYKFGVDIFGFGWKAPSGRETRELAYDPGCWTWGLTSGAVKESRHGFFLHDWIPDPKVILIHNHHKVSLLCPWGNCLAAMVRTSCAAFRWNTHVKTRCIKEMSQTNAFQNFDWEPCHIFSIEILQSVGLPEYLLD